MALRAAIQRSPQARRLPTAAGRTRHLLLALVAVAAVAAGMADHAQAQPGAQGQTRNTLLGEIENLMITNPTDPWSGGWARIGGQDFVLPRNFLIDLPANRLSLHDLFAQAPPACLALGQSGLARADSCLGGRSGAYASTMNANRLGSGTTVLGEIWIDKGLESLEGVISYINYDDGYFRINGTGTSGGTMRVTALRLSYFSCSKCFFLIVKSYFQWSPVTLNTNSRSWFGPHNSASFSPGNDATSPV